MPSTWGNPHNVRVPDVTRRRMLRTAGAAVAAAFAAEFLPPGVRRALASGPAQGGSLSDIKHVVILMQENRSFDHYFGALANVRGFNDPTAMTLSTGKPVFYQPDTEHPDGYLLPFHLDTRTTSAQAQPSTSHAWGVQHSAWNGGLMNNWLPAHLAADGANGRYTMGYLDRDDIPFHYALAENFTICDSYHCSVFGPTWPNRLYHLSAWNDPQGDAGGPVTADAAPDPLGWKTYPEVLTEAGVSWRVYQEVDNYQCNSLELFRSFQSAPVSSTLFQSGLRAFSPGQFEYDAANDRLPVVSWIVPTSYQSEHPDYTPAAGADFVASKIEAIASNPDVWNSTVFILNYDENDGLFDHVAPPTAPAGTPGEYIDGLPIGAGFRVPCIIVSPWTQGGWISSGMFDHTSVLQFLELLTGVTIPNLTPWRRATFGNLASAFGTPASVYPPRLPDTKAALARAVYEVTALPPAQIPAGNQAPPAQQAGSLPRPRPAIAGEQAMTW
jgi:phospholipase C